MILLFYDSPSPKVSSHVSIPLEDIACIFLTSDFHFQEAVKFTLVLSSDSVQSSGI